MRCPVCQTRLQADATQCDCGALVKVIPAAVAPPLIKGGRRIEFLGDGATLFGMHLLYLAMTAVTVGIYHFWAKVKVRQYVYSMTRFEGDRFAYHGQGQELLIGWLKVAGIFGITLGLGLFLQFGLKISEGELIGKLVAGVVAFVLLPVALAGAQRYRLSRTSWRGVRFSFRGATREFWGRWVGWSLLTTVTAGLAYPFFMNEVRRFMVDNSWFGNRKFSYTGDGKDLFGPFILMAVLFVPTFGLAWFGYKARRERYYWEHTHFEEATFACTVTGSGLFSLWITNMVLLSVTLWFARPWAQVRSMHYLTSNLQLVGPLDVDRVEQEIQQAGAAGEGLTEFVETGFFDVELGL
ncbi:MAG: conserved rane protein of unknown function [Cyanobacteria bacterium RYN_339]|nr:conserved rane protein of unknown function [Cyanobacteria bacterium RYN_339]